MAHRSAGRARRHRHPGRPRAGPGRSPPVPCGGDAQRDAVRRQHDARRGRGVRRRGEQGGAPRGGREGRRRGRRGARAGGRLTGGCRPTAARQPLDSRGRGSDHPALAACRFGRGAFVGWVTAVLALPRNRQEDPMQYAILIYDENSANPTAEAPPPEVIKQVMDEYFAYSQMLRDRGAFRAGEALQPVQSATTIRTRDGETTTTDGPFADRK